MLEALLKQNVRVNKSDKTLEVYDDYGVKMKVVVTDEQIAKLEAEGVRTW